MVPKITSPTGGGRPTPTDTKGTDSDYPLLEKPLQAIHMKRKVAPPSWSERLKSVGLVFGTVACGALALGLLPFTIVGGICILAGKRLKTAEPRDSENFEKAKALKKIGFVIAPPLAGCYACIKELRRDQRSASEYSLMRWVELALTAPGDESKWSDEDTRVLASKCTLDGLRNIYNAALKLSQTALGAGKDTADEILNLLLAEIIVREGKEKDV